MQSTLSATGMLTPSEIVFIHGEQFSKAKKDGMKLPRGGEPVEADDLARAMVGAALLANQKAGALKLQEGIEKHMFGLLKRKAVHVVVVGADPAWPKETLEARVWSVASQRPAKGEWTVRGVVAALFPADDPNPYVEIVRWAERALQGRGLVDEVVEEKKTLGIFKYKNFSTSLNAAGSAVVARHPLGPVQEMIAAATRAQPDVAARMQAEVRGGLYSRVESTSDSDYGDSSSD